jgi:hypothetical protein
MRFESSRPAFAFENCFATRCKYTNREIVAARLTLAVCKVVVRDFEMFREREKMHKLLKSLVRGSCTFYVQLFALRAAQL